MASRIAGIAGASLVFLMAAGTPNITEGRDFEHGAVMVGVGGGYIEDALFQNGNEYDATFSFFAGLDKWGNVRGSLVFKRINKSGKPGVVISTEITDLQVTQDVCPWIHMEGIAKFKAYWNPQSVPGRRPLRDHTFTLDAFDCDDGADQIWFELRYPGGGPRPGMSLWDYTPVDLASGHVMIPYPDDLP
jgi:hypothetical protein